MSSHQPPRPYGPPFNPHIPVSAPPAANYGMQRYPNQPPAFNGYWQGQNPPNGMSFPQISNGFPHHVNGQNSASPAFSNRAAPTAYGGYPGMPQYSAAPAQFFSAAPSSYTIAPHLAPSHNAQKNPYEVPANNSSYETPSNKSSYEIPPTHPSNNLSNQRVLPTTPFMDVEDPAAVKEPSIDLEDGELSSEEQEKASGDLDDKSATVHERSAPETPHTGDAELQDTADQAAPFNAVNHTSRPQPKPAEAQSSLQNHSTIAPSDRERAQSILRELHSFDIGFEDIAGEGLDVGLLRKLFVETGLPLPALGENQSLHSRGEMLHQDASTQNGNQNTSQGPPTALSMKPVLDTPSTISKSDDGHTSALKPNTLVTPTQEPNLGKVAAKIPTTKPLDRKEYIARLMAAKIGKSQNSEVATDTSEASSKTNIAASGTENSPSEKAGINPAADLAATHTGSVLALGEIQNGTPDFEAKRKAQTDLALQKMEALRSQKKLQEKVQSANTKEKDDGPPPLVVEVGSTPSSHTEYPRPTEVPTPSDGRQTSYFSPVSLKAAFNIPGLFSMPQEVTTDVLKEPSETTKAPELVPVVEGDSTETGVGPRKRLKAADFMDSMPNTIHKSLSKGEDPSVVIDISDDDGDYLDGDTGPKPPGQTPHASATTISRKETQDSDFVSPPGGNTPGRSQENTKLKMKESKIDAMNRKILELEQRIKTKQAASRAQSPRPPIPSSSHSAIASDPQQPSMLALQRVESATEEQLLKEKEKQEVQLATAEAEQLQIARKEERLDVERVPSPQASSDGPVLQVLPQVLDPRNDEYRLDQTDDLSESTDPQKAKLQNELSVLDATITSVEEGIQRANLDIEHLNEQLGVAKVDMDHRLSQLQSKADRRQLLQRQLSSMPQQPSNDQKSQQPPREAMEVDTERVNRDYLEDGPDYDSSGALPSQSATANQDGLAPSQPVDLEFQVRNGQPDPKVVTEATEPEVESENTNGRPVEPFIVSESASHPSDHELEEDIMDISGSDVDEGEVLEAPQESISQREDDMDDLDEGEVLEAHRDSSSKPEDVMDTSDDEDFYEPPSHVGSIQQHSITVSQSEQQVSHSEVEEMDPDAKDAPWNVKVSAQTQQDQNLKQTPDRGFMLEEEKDEDDYEPPEPESSAVRGADPPPHSSPSEVANDGTAEAVAKDDLLMSKTASEGEHFMPYESPLKQFTSYRFHPEFVNEVPGGYRSLTYSNDIQPEVELCQYELSGGVCNDESCKSQHFQKMMLPDHIILSAMGKGEGSTPEEKDQYIKGLKSLIIDLRERKVKDLDAIATAIAQYRLTFLKDNSKVLPL